MQICKFFLDAVEKSKYGWFWACPNGESCHYRHALPPGFILKRDAKKLAEETKKLRDEFTLEDLIEKERAALGSQNLTRVTLETFMMWKVRNCQFDCKQVQSQIVKLHENSNFLTFRLDIFRNGS